ncbi:bis(5'-nucleosyl)-tetraphosphatase (symmetrical) YqeK [Streptococcus cameli]
MNYQAYTGLNREELLGKVKASMSEKRFQHVLGVEKAALDLAEQYGCDSTKASLAALLHDVAKEREDQVFLETIREEGLDPDLIHWGNNIWHGVVGAYLIAKEFQLTDTEILTAIQRHTVGAKDMTLLDKVLYVADYIEPGRDFPGVDRARELAKLDLDQAVAFETAQTVAHLAKKAIPIYPQTLETYNAYIGHWKP